MPGSHCQSSPQTPILDKLCGWMSKIRKTKASSVGYILEEVECGMTIEVAVRAAGKGIKMMSWHAWQIPAGEPIMSELSRLLYVSEKSRLMPLWELGRLSSTHRMFTRELSDAWPYVWCRG